MQARWTAAQSKRGDNQHRYMGGREGTGKLQHIGGCIGDSARSTILDEGTEEHVITADATAVAASDAASAPVAAYADTGAIPSKGAAVGYAGI